jgi:hypothetical protein
LEGYVWCEAGDGLSFTLRSAPEQQLLLVSSVYHGGGGGRRLSQEGVQGVLATHLPVSRTLARLLLSHLLHP